MGTTVVRPPAEDVSPASDDRALRRLLVIVLAVLLAAAVALVVVLFTLVGPREKTPKSPAARAGYPIKVVRSISTVASGRPLRAPLAVAFAPNDRLWISDTGNSRVLITSSHGKLVRVLGATGANRLGSPYGIAVDASRQRVYVADWTSRAVFVYSLTGRYLTRFPSAEQDLAVFGPNGFSPYDVKMVGSRLVAASNDGLYFFDHAGMVTARWGGAGRAAAVGSFNFPDAFAVDPATGAVYVADTLNRRLVALDRAGKVQWVSGTPDQGGKTTGFWQLPRGVAIGGDGRLYVTDTFRFDGTGVGVGHLVVLAPDGTLVSEFGRAGLEEDSLNFPEKLAVGPRGVYAIADRASGRVLVFRLGRLPAPEVDELTSYRRSFSRPTGVAVATKVTATTTTSP